MSSILIIPPCPDGNERKIWPKNGQITKENYRIDWRLPEKEREEAVKIWALFAI